MVASATGITRGFDSAYYYGSTTGAVPVGSVFDVAIGGRGYMLDLLPEGGGNGYSVKSLPLLQRYYLTQQAGNIGEQSLNPSDYWRRSVDSWVNGSGQLYNDRDTSQRNQYHASKGINPWTPGQISLLHDTTKILTSANTNLRIVMAGTYLYVLDGTALKYTQDGSSYTTVTGAGFSSPVSLHSDGYTVWVSDATDTYYTTRGGATYATWFASPRPGTLVRSVKGRLFVCNSNIIYTSSGSAGSATATAFFTHPNSDFTWQDISEGPTAIYFAGFSGDKSIIYQTAVVADGTSLAIPAAAATLPSGELVRAIVGYLGVMNIGTDLGVRVAAIDSSGNLTVGDLISTGTSVRCFEPQSHFVWFGWTNYDATSTGLGRLDLGTFNSSAPAYASDLMSTAQGAVLGVVTFLNLRCYAVSGSGIWAEASANLVASGTITSGLLNYSLPDTKIAVKYDLACYAGAGTVTAALATDNQSFNQIGAAVTTSSTSAVHSVQTTANVSGLLHEIQLTLAYLSSDHTQGPVVNRWTLMCNPAPTRRVQIVAALLLHRQTRLRSGAYATYNPIQERQDFDALLQSSQIVTFQDSEASYPVTVDDYEWKAYDNVDAKNHEWDGTITVTLKEIT